MTRSEAVLPETVQTAGVVETKLTASPELAVAAKLICVVAYAVAVIVGKVRLWLRGLTVMFCETGGAAP